jgi:hypothetical protein
MGKMLGFVADGEGRFFRKDWCSHSSRIYGGLSCPLSYRGEYNVW